MLAREDGECEVVLEIRGGGGVHLFWAFIFPRLKSFVEWIRFANIFFRENVEESRVEVAHTGFVSGVGLIVLLGCEKLDGSVGFNMPLHELLNRSDPCGSCDLVHESSIEVDGAFAFGISCVLAAADSIINFLWKDETDRGFFRHLIVGLEKFTVLFQF